MSIFKKAIAGVCCLCTAFSMVGCGGGGDNFTSENVDLENGILSGSLNIRVWEGGFGLKWLDNVIDAFNDKYPDVTIKVDPSVERMQVFGDITGKGSKYDLVFQDARLMDYTDCLEPLDDVYAYTNKGESVAVGDKLFDLYRECLNYKGSYYQIPYAVGTYGIVYNSDYISDSEVPVTTDELIALCANLKSASLTPIIFSGETGTGYWDFAYATWFAQYEGRDAYWASLSGQIIDENGEKKYDPSTAYLQGGLEAMQVCEDLLWYQNGYIETSSTGLQFIIAQRDFLKGKAAMMYNGSWLFNEMELMFPNGTDYDFKMMKMPVISSIVDKCTTIDNDAELSSLIKAIDAGATSFSGVNEVDFETVKAARNFYYAGAEGATAGIPINARNKQIAKEFLKFMYSEAGIEAHADAKVGCVLPVKDINMAIPTDNTFTETTYSIMLNNEVFFNNAVMAVTPYCTDTAAGMIEKQFGSQNSADRTTAADSFAAKKTLWTANDNEKFWNELISKGYISARP